MSTRSNIVIERKNKRVDKIYCHSDGYLSYNGKILLNNYKDIDKINYLISKGDMSYLMEEVEYCKFYEDGNSDAKLFKSLEKYLKQVDTLWIEYVYVFKESEGKWYYVKTNDNYKNKRPVEMEDLRLLTQEEIDREK